METTTVRPIHIIYNDIKNDWKKVNYAAAPYLTAMRYLDKITDTYYMESGKDVVLRFLVHAGTWRGETAKRIKLELKSLIK